MVILRSVYALFVFLSLLSLTITDSVLSQPPGVDQVQMTQNNQPGQQGGQIQGLGGQQDFGQRQGLQSEQMQDMISQSLKQMLGSTDEEWSVIGPMVLKVYSLVSSQSSGVQIRSIMGRSGNQGSQMRGVNRPSFSSTEDVALEELKSLLESEETTNTQLKNKVSEIRNAREKSRQDLVKARKELREILTLKQEATLISVGLLE